jgi:hypothetical protein
MALSRIRNIVSNDRKTARGNVPFSLEGSLTKLDVNKYIKR